MSDWIVAAVGFWAVAATFAVVVLCVVFVSVLRYWKRAEKQRHEAASEVRRLSDELLTVRAMAANARFFAETDTPLFPEDIVGDGQ